LRRGGAATLLGFSNAQVNKFSCITMTKAKVSIDKESLNRVLELFTKTLEDSANQGIKNGLFHLPDSDRNALWVASDLIEKSGKFPNYKLTFYHKGMGEGTNTCAVTFVHL
jgi:hypothetical protein